MSDIKFSIITASLNSEKYIEDTILSVANQTYENKEHIIIDGGSVDSTLNILEKYNKEISYCISEPDNGIADAMNKGIKKATGDYLLFINSDDYLINDQTLFDIYKNILDRLDIYFFKVQFIFPDERVIVSKNNNLGIKTYLKMGSCHQGQVISRKLFEKHGLYDQNLKIGMDYDFILRILKKNIKSKSVDLVIACMRRIGVSSQTDWDGLIQRLNDEQQVHDKNCKNRICKIFYQVYWFFYLKYKRIKYVI